MGSFYLFLSLDVKKKYLDALDDKKSFDEKKKTQKKKGIENWLREIEKWCPSLSYRSYYGGQSERLESQDEIKYNLKSIDIIVTTYNMATGNKDDRAFLRKLSCKSMILDEGRTSFFFVL